MQLKPLIHWSIEQTGCCVLWPRGHEPEHASSHLLDKQADYPKPGCPQGLRDENNFLGYLNIRETNTPIKTHYIKEENSLISA